MDIDKAIDAARALVSKSDKLYYHEFRASGFICLTDSSKPCAEFQALKEALEDKPSREEVVKYHEDYLKQIAKSNSYILEEKITKATIELLKQPTISNIATGEK